MLLFGHVLMSVLLVEEVIVNFDLSVGFEIVRQQHDRNRHLAEIIDLQKEETNNR